VAGYYQFQFLVTNANCRENEIRQLWPFLEAEDKIDFEGEVAWLSGLVALRVKKICDRRNNNTRESHNDLLPNAQSAGIAKRSVRSIFEFRRSSKRLPPISGADDRLALG